MNIIEISSDVKPEFVSNTAINLDKLLTMSLSGREVNLFFQGQMVKTTIVGTNLEEAKENMLLRHTIDLKNLA